MLAGVSFTWDAVCPGILVGGSPNWGRFGGCESSPSSPNLILIIPFTTETFGSINGASSLIGCSVISVTDNEISSKILADSLINLSDLSIPSVKESKYSLYLFWVAIGISFK